MPAVRRYSGTFYRVAGNALASVPPNMDVVVLSGGYGVLLLDEPIGYYDRKFTLTDWPEGLLQTCLLEVARDLGSASVVALCSRTSDYAALVRSTPWGRIGVSATLATPDLMGRRGAQVLVPRATGEALASLFTGELEADWSSSDSVPLEWERLA